MKKKTRYLLATTAAVSMWLSVVFICLHYHTIGHISWFKFPFYESTPIAEFVCYKDELLYFGLFEQAIDINLSYDDLLIIHRLSKEDVIYDTKKQSHLSEKQLFDYEPADKGRPLYDDWCIKDYYNVAHPDHATEWKERALEY